jgi:RNA polymerase sigma factor (sigma-70 family)
LSDRQLLERFTTGQDAEAFTLLVRRHGPLVWGVCRWVLHNWHNAEDAFQATFVVLARKAGSIRNQETVGGWLYRVAYRTAMKARAQAVTRQKHERQSDRPSADPLDELTGRELLAVLDEELLRLPASYREPLVLCYLEGQTRDQAARQLAWSLRTLKRRLEQGKKLLATRLARRGLTLSAGLLVVRFEPSAATAAVLPRLAGLAVKQALQVGAGKGAGGSTPATALAETVVKGMAAAKLRAVIACLLVVGGAVLGVGALMRPSVAGPQVTAASAAASEVPATAPVPQVQPEKQTAGPTPAEPGSEAKEKMPVFGRVLDADGKPVPGAKVAVVSRPRRRLRGWEWSAFAFDVLDAGQTTPEGRYRLSVPPPSGRLLTPVTLPFPRDETALVAGAEGHGVAWRSLEGEFNPSEMAISLPREQVLHGRLIDLQGQPATGVQLVVARVRNKTPARGAEQIDFRTPPMGLAPWPRPVTTDKQGRFALHGIGRGQVVTLEVRDDRFARQHLELGAADRHRSEDAPIPLAPPRLITGLVVRADTGVPVANTRVAVWASQAEPRRSLGEVAGWTDGQGRFQINPFPGTSFGVTAFAPEGEPYLNPHKTLVWPKGAVRQEIEIALPRGVLVRGTITEAASGKPVAGATVDFEPYSFSSPDVQFVGVWATSGPDGAFRLAVPPVPGHLLVNGPVPDYILQAVGENDLRFGRPGGPPRYWHAVLALDLKPEDKTKDMRVTLRRGVTLTGLLIGPDGRPVPRAQMLCGSLPPPLEAAIRPVQVRGGRFELRGCDPARTYPILFLTGPCTPGINWISVGRRAAIQMKLHLPAFFGGKDWLGAAVQISAKQAGSEPIQVRLASCGSVVLRLVNGREQLQPLIKLSPPLDLVVTTGPDLNEAWDQSVMGGEIVALSDDPLWMPVSGFRTDAQGRVTLTGLIPGATYRINNLDWTTAKDFTAPAGGSAKPEEITIKLR